MLLIVSVSLSSCGGGGSGESPPVSNNPLLTVVSGDNQTGLVGVALLSPVIVSLMTNTGAAIANENLNILDSGGATTTAQTDAAGRVSFDWQLGDAYRQTLTFSYQRAGGPLVSVSATAVALYQYRAPSSDPEWPASHANTVGVEPDQLEDMINAIRRGDYPRVHSVLIARNGQLVLEESFPLIGETSYTRSDAELHYVASASKSITATLVGIAIDQGLIASVDDSLYSYFPEYGSFDNWSAEKDDLTIRDALMMRSGLGCADDGSWEATADFVKTTLDLPLNSAPGSVWKYCTMLTHVLGSAVANAAGMNLSNYAQTYLWDPIGTSTLGWTYSPAGRAITGYGFWMRPRDMLKFGELILNRGQWQGNPVVSEQWVEESAYTAATQTGLGGDLYGYQWWVREVRHDGVTHRVPFAAGDGGQMIFVLRDHGVTAVFTGGNYGTNLTGQPVTLLEQFVVPTLN